VRRAFASLLVAVVMVTAFASIGQARARKNPCQRYEERTGCVLRGATYYIPHRTQPIGTSVNSSTSGGYFIVHVGQGQGVCTAEATDAFEVKQKLRIGGFYTFSDNAGDGPVSGSLKVVSAKKATMMLTTSNPAVPGYPACNQTVKVPLERIHT
jgi:hypothetical protein